ncbi:MAG: asparagine synthase (glutamine-hydrolyzing) [Clostridia bacterium]|nr:asparagine synthase (glutamine-hydrolyzing) [Clostridia bacterium]
MCGIAGHINLNDKPGRELSGIYEKMQRSLSRRGPDQQGMFYGDGAVLVHARLCVVDIENGRQPMSLPWGDEEYVLVYNGELYNTDEIRKKLALKGHEFIGHSDTEVLLHAYAEWKDGCLSELNGIFAFAVWEKRRHRLFAARDRIGVKPFFYAVRGDDFLFASELKTLLCHPKIRPEIDAGGLSEVMFIGPGRTPGCGVFRDVFELLPGECGYFTGNGGFKKHIYWRLEDREHTDNFEQTAEKVRELVTDAIRRQLVSDVPVCTFLSGGLDSGIISAVADRHFIERGMKLHTVSVDYRDNERYFHAGKFQPNSDTPFIEIMNGVLKAEPHMITLDTPELAAALYPAVAARDLPGMADVDSSLLLFCEEIKKIATVALSGECADEIFGGYPWYRDKEIREREGFPWAQSTACRASFLKEEFLKEIDPAEYVDARYRRTVKNTDILPGTSPEESRMKEMMNLNLGWFMQTLLDRKDRMSMYSGLEVRVPFCDYRIAEYLYAVPWEFKNYKNVEKGLLRYAVRGLLPEEILWRKKSPYPKTHNPEYLKEVSEELQKVIGDPAAPIHRFVKKEALQGLLYADNPVPWYGQLMTTPQTIAYFLQLNYWLDSYRVSYI